jgi:biotin transporter BioY
MALIGVAVLVIVLGTLATRYFSPAWSAGIVTVLSGGLAVVAACGAAVIGYVIGGSALGYVLPETPAILLQDVLAIVLAMIVGRRVFVAARRPRSR